MSTAAHVVLPRVAASDRALIEPAVGECIDRLIADLALPGGGTSQVTISEGDRPLVLLNGRRCRFVHTVADGAGAPWSYGICETIQANAQLLLTREIVAAAWENARGRGDLSDAFARALGRVVGHWVSPRRISSVTAASDAMFEDALCEGSNAVRIFVDRSVFDALATVQPVLEELGRFLAENLSDELGLVLGAPRFELDEALPPYHYGIGINDVVTTPQRALAPDQVLVDHTPAYLKSVLGLDGEPATHPVTGRAATIVAASDRDRCLAHGLSPLRFTTHLALVAAGAVRRHAGKLYSRDVLAYQLGVIAEDDPVVARHVERLGGVNALTPVFRSLLEERVSIRDMSHMVEALVNAPALPALDASLVVVSPRAYRPSLPFAAPCERTTLEMAAAARLDQWRAITYAHTGATGTIEVLLVDDAIETRLRDPAPLSEAEHEDLVEAIGAQLDSAPPTARTPSILTSLDVRVRLRRAIAVEYPAISVLALAELGRSIEVQPLATISALERAS